MHIDIFKLASLFFDKDALTLETKLIFNAKTSVAANWIREKKMLQQTKLIFKHKNATSSWRYLKLKTTTNVTYLNIKRVGNSVECECSTLRIIRCEKLLWTCLKLKNGHIIYYYFIFYFLFMFSFFICYFCYFCYFF